MLTDAIRSTLSTVLGDVGGLFAQQGVVFAATLEIDDDADLPGGTELLVPGRRDALVRLAPVTDLGVSRTVCVKVPDAYGGGRGQDFLLASSGDGAPMHHAVVPTSTPAHLYSSLWLYLAGIEPVAFGARVHDASPGPGDRIDFLVSGVLSRFRTVGSLELHGEATGTDVTFAASTTGGGLRALPPASFYRG